MSLDKKGTRRPPENKVEGTPWWALLREATYRKTKKVNLCQTTVRLTGNQSTQTRYLTRQSILQFMIHFSVQFHN